MITAKVLLKVKFFPFAIAIAISSLPLSLARADTGTYDDVINRMMNYQGHAGVLLNQSVMIDPQSCGRTDWYVLLKSNEHFKESYALLLAAHVSGRKVSFILSGCEYGMPVIKHVAMGQG